MEEIFVYGEEFVSCIVVFDIIDICFFMFLSLDGLDVMNFDFDYFVVYVIVCMDVFDDIEGYVFVFMIGCGNDVQVVVIDVFVGYLVGCEIELLFDDMGGIFCDIIGDLQLCWLGFEKGVMYMVIGVVINVLWDIKVKCVGLLLWQLFVWMMLEEFVDFVDFCYFINVFICEEVLEILCVVEFGWVEWEQQFFVIGYLGYMISFGWFGYFDEKFEWFVCEVMVDGFMQIKFKVGVDLEDDICWFWKVCEVCGFDFLIVIDVNQCWEVLEVIEWVNVFVEFYFVWIEEFISFDDVFGYVEIVCGIVFICVVIGEYVQNCVIFKQLLQVEVIFVMQIDVVCVVGVNENIVNLLLVVKFDVLVCLYVGGVGLCEVVQYLLMFDFVVVIGICEGWMIEFVDYLYEYFVVLIDIWGGFYMVLIVFGVGMEMKVESIVEYIWMGVYVIV